MTTGIVHTTASDGTFSGSGATAWNAAHSINETGGASLGVGAISDGQYVIRSGTNLVGTTGTSVSTPVFPGGIALTGVSYPACDGHNLPTGDNDLYTVPTGKRAIVTNAIIYNSSAGNITWYPEVKISGTYYRLLASTTTATVQGAASASIAYIAEAGEVIAVNTATTAGLNIWIQMVVFDNTCLVYSSKLTSLANGDNTLYTTPSGKTAYIIGTNFIPGAQLGQVIYVNSSGGARTVLVNTVPSGSAVGTSNISGQAASVNDATRSAFNVGGYLDTGDFININTNAATATQMAWVNVMEI